LCERERVRRLSSKRERKMVIPTKQLFGAPTPAGSKVLKQHLATAVHAADGGGSGGASLPHGAF
jgi:hypothetical protein